MRVFVLLVLIVSVFSHGVGASPVTRILDGKIGYDAVQALTAVITSKKDGKEHLCTASVLNEYWLLTAAHCEIMPDDEVRVGRRNLEEEPDNYVVKVVKHDRYSDEHPLPKHDIALVKLWQSIRKEECDELPRVTIYDNTSVPYDKQGETAGYGYYDRMKNDGKFRWEQLTIYGTQTCQDMLEKAIGKDFKKNDFNSKYYLCAGDKTVTCPGDYGGPLLFEGVDGESFVQIGVRGGGGTCGEDGTPNVYTSVRGHSGWILDNVHGDVLITRYLAPDYEADEESDEESD